MKANTRPVVISAPRMDRTFPQPSDMVKCDAGRLADVLVHRQFFIKQNAKVAHNTNWLDCQHAKRGSVRSALR